MADLLVEDIHTAYGLSQVLFGVSLEVHPGECIALIGRNGVGKTTTMRSIMGLTPPASGRVVWKGRDITREAPFRAAGLGIGFVPEDRRIFADLTVWENLDVAERRTRPDGFTTERVFDLFPALRQLRDRPGGFLSGGEQQMLTIARTLMGNPELLLLDEPTAGMSATETRDAIRLIERIARARGLTLLFTEHDMEVVFSIAERITVLHQGRVIANGPPDEVRRDEAVRRVYLGERH